MKNNISDLRPFHLALPTANLLATIAFYSNILECEIGRRDSTWVDFNFFGHQLVFHESDIVLPSAVNPVDAKQVAVPHFGILVTPDQWVLLKNLLISKDISFLIDPYERFKGTSGEQYTMFFG